MILAKNANARRNTAGAVLDDVAGKLNATNLIFGQMPQSSKPTPNQQQQQHRIWRPLMEATSVPSQKGESLKTPVSGRKSTPR